MGYSFGDFLNDLQPVGVGIQNVIGGEQKLVGGVFNTLFSTVGGIGKDISGTLSSLSTPLLLLGGGILLLLSVLKK